MSTIQPSAQCWLDYRHPEWTKWSEAWERANDFYTGDCIRPEKLRKYLSQKASAEHDEAFRDRLNIPNYDHDFGTVVDKLRGVLFSAESRANYLPSLRVREKVKGPDGTILSIEKWGDGLGDPTDKDTLAGRLEYDADGQGNGRSVVMERLATELLVTGDAWQMIGMIPRDDNSSSSPYLDEEGGDRSEMLPVYQVLSALSVVNWQINSRNNLLEWALISEEYDARASWTDGPDSATSQRYLLVNKDGWSRWLKNDKKEAVQTGEGGTWEYYNRRDQRVVPLRHVTLPTTRKVGPALADKAQVLLNKQSELDAVSRNSAFPLLSLVGDDNSIDQLARRIREGNKVLQRNPDWRGDHSFISPSSDSLEVRLKAIQQERKAFHSAAFLQYGDSIGGVQKSATQVNAETHSGIGAFLTTIKSTIDDSEGWFLGLIAQAQWRKGSPGEKNWWKATQERSDTFAPLDPDAAVSADIEKFFGSKEKEPAPLGRSAQVQGARQIASYMGVIIDNNEAEAAVDLVNAQRYGSLMASYGIEVPPDMKAQIAERIARALGLNGAQAIAQAVNTSAEQGVEQAEAARLAQADTAPAPAPPSSDPTVTA